jgi:hypothetical protein
MAAPQGSSADMSSLVARLTSYLFPGGEESARRVRAITTVQRGEIRSGPEARWIPFTAEEVVDATRTMFRWEARVGSGLLSSVSVTDAYEDGHGRLVVRKGPVQLQKLVGPDFDRGELQRYLGYIMYCPPMLLNNPSLDLAAIGPKTLRVRDRHDLTDASVDMEIDEEGRPHLTRAMRPMTVGKNVIMTPWTAAGSDTQEWDGLRVCRQMEASWHLADGVFPYIRIELTSFAALR